jgi:hypothetical protein
MVTVKIESTYKQISKWGKFKVMFLSTPHPTNTVMGTTNKAICVQEPTATPSDKSFQVTGKEPE